MADFIKTIKEWLFDQDEEENIEKEENPAEKTTVNEQLTADSDGRIMIYRSAEFRDSMKYGEMLKSGIILILCLKSNERDTQRLLDFLSGVLMSQNGQIKMLTENMVICVPSNTQMKEIK